MNLSGIMKSMGIDPADITREYQGMASNMLAISRRLEGIEAALMTVMRNQATILATVAPADQPAGNVVMLAPPTVPASAGVSTTG